jgi:hypothetical protein
MTVVHRLGSRGGAFPTVGHGTGWQGVFIHVGYQTPTQHAHTR